MGLSARAALCCEHVGEKTQSRKPMGVMEELWAEEPWCKTTVPFPPGWGHCSPPMGCNVPCSQPTLAGPVPCSSQLCPQSLYVTAACPPCGPCPGLPFTHHISRGTPTNLHPGSRVRRTSARQGTSAGPRTQHQPPGTRSCPSAPELRPQGHRSTPPVPSGKLVLLNAS